MKETLFMLYNWDMSDKAIAEIETADIGRVINITEPRVPLVTEDENGYYLYGFSAENMIPDKYVQAYAVAEVDINQILLEMQAVEKLLGAAPVLIVDPFSDNTERKFALRQVREGFKA